MVRPENMALSELPTCTLFCDGITCGKRHGGAEDDTKYLMDTLQTLTVIL